MGYEYFYDAHNDPSKNEIEIVERKGIGHPDSVADIIAELISNRYADYTLEHFGKVLNHWFDKVTISGGEAIIGPSYARVIKKPKVYLFGKVTRTTDDDIPLAIMFEETVHDVFSRIFGVPNNLLPQIGDVPLDVPTTQQYANAAGS